MSIVGDILRIPAALTAVARFAQRDLRSLRNLLMDFTGRLDQVERDLRIIRSATDVIRRRSAIILEPGRALALLTNGYQLFVDPQDKGGAVNLLANGCIEEAELKVLRRILRPGMTMLDIGANYGYYSMVAAPFLRNDGRILGFEPNPRLQQLYRSSIQLNGFGNIIELHAVGASDRNDVIKFEVEVGYPGGGRIPRPDDEPRKGHETLEVPVVQIDDYLPKDLVVDFVKIDVEGHEAQVVNGMRRLIERSPNIVIFMEFFFNFFRDEEAAGEMLRTLVEDLGLTIQRIIGGGRVVAADLESLRGAECTLALSRGGLPNLPDLTFHPGQFHLGADTRLEGGKLSWRRSPAGGEISNTIAFGPYLYLPRGHYRVVVDGDFEGKFLCRISDNFGDPLFEFFCGVEGGAENRIWLPVDAKWLEIVIECVSDGAASATLRQVEFWPT